MTRHPLIFRASAAALVVAMLAGCGAQAMAPAASASLQRTIQAASVDAIDVDKLIADFKAIQGFDEPAMRRRSLIVTELADSDDDRAMAFLQAEYENLASYPEAVRPAFETRLADAIDSLDTYEPTLDDPIIAAGPGTTAIEAAAYRDALARRKRHKGLLHWLTAPFRWLGEGLKWLIGGKKKKKKKRRRPRPDPGYPADPYPPGGGYDPYPPTR